MSSTARTDAHRDPQAPSGNDSAAPTAGGCGTGGAGLGCGGCSLQGSDSCSTTATAEPTAPLGCSAAAQAAPEPTGRERMAGSMAGVSPLVSGGVVVVLVLAGLVLGGTFGLVLTVLGILAFGALAALSWSRLTLAPRLLRVAVLVFALGVTIIRFVPA